MNPLCSICQFYWFCSSREPWLAQLPQEIDQKLLHNEDANEDGEFTGTRRVIFQLMLLKYFYYLKSYFPPLVYENSSEALKQIREQSH